MLESREIRFSPVRAKATPHRWLRAKIEFQHTEQAGGFLGWTN
jgi:hypothetical protein